MNMDITKFLRSLPQGKGARETYSSTISDLEVTGVSKFYGLFLAILQLRSQDLLPRYDLSNEADRRQFLGWTVVHGRREYVALQELSEFWNELGERADIPLTIWSGGITRLLQLAVEERKDLGIDASLANEEDQRRALAWYWLQGGLNELGVTAGNITYQEKMFWLDSDALSTSRFGLLVDASRPDINAHFKLAGTDSARLYEEWLISAGMVETSLPLLLHTVPRAWPPAQYPCATDRFPSGVNLIGYAFGELGIGEDVRMAAYALLAAGVPFTIIDFQPGKEIRQADRSVEQWVAERPIYDTNLVCLTALEHLRFYLERGTDAFAGRYTIGYWPWELHDWPNAWKHCFTLIDEIWASSRHIQRSAQAATNKTVRYMPMAVKLPEEFNSARDRARWKLPEGAFIFVFSFDGNSFIQRKNPEAILKAFNEAFSVDDDSVRLLIKCMRPNPQNIAWKTVLGAAESDYRIIILDAMLTKSDVLDLYSACDCFVSLHRAEGFGRGIAEAFLLGLDVVATDYGGNVDFCRQLGPYNIAHTLIGTSVTDYVEGADNFWAEPDISHAAIAMKQAATHDSPMDQQAVFRDNRLHDLFSPAAVGARYRVHLESLARFR
jgi:glycosyltransferase involved in cell wall biosynthesis